MTSNQIEMAKLNETKRANLSREQEDRRHNIRNEQITREGNASKVGSPFGLISLAGERAVYGTDATPANLDHYIQTGVYPESDESVAQNISNPGIIYQTGKQSGSKFKGFKNAVKSLKSKLKIPMY